MKIAYVFPGQGTQHIGMGVEIAEQYPEARELYDRASAVLGFDLLEMCRLGPKAVLQQTENTQPSILVTSLACLAAVEPYFPKASIAAGLSLGEYSALVTAGALNFEDAVLIARKRGILMQEATAEEDVSMAAILGLEVAQVEALCKQASSLGVCEPANYNSPNQIVIGGNAPAVERAAKLAQQVGARGVVPLAVSAPFHTRLMLPAAERLAKLLETIPIRDPAFPLLTNVTAQPVTQAKEIRRLLVKQVANPVLWMQSVQRMVCDGIDTFIEFGPGKTVSNLIKRTTKKVQTLNVENHTSIVNALKVLRDKGHNPL